MPSPVVLHKILIFPHEALVSLNVPGEPRRNRDLVTRPAGTSRLICQLNGLFVVIQTG